MSNSFTPPYKNITEASRIYLLPNLFTAGNLFFGYLAIINCIEARYSMENEVAHHLYIYAVWFIIFACICDVLDGLVARLGGRESLFGKEFDSIADVVSFGVAPALMVFFLILPPTEGLPVFRQAGWLIGFIYLLCAGVRLARFNVLTTPLLPKEKDGESKAFQGFPTTAAAGTIASLALVIMRFDDLRWFSILLPALMLLIAWLMVSSIPYPSIKSINWHAEARMRPFVLVVALVSVGFLFRECAFAVFFLCYIFYGLWMHLKGYLSLKRGR
tara:strand:+ start:20179 stop:20997 length:819 start_codon:yes stop_codon:yes gene_type:complete